MNAPDPIWTIHATLSAKGFTYIGPPATYQGPIKVHGKTVTIEAAFSDPSFATLPVVRLVEGAALGDRQIAHLLVGGGICYTDEGGLVLDLYDPGGAALRVLDEAAKALERSFGASSSLEFDNELAAYWRGRYFYSALSLPSSPAIVVADIVKLGTGKPSGLVLVARGAWQAKGNTREQATVLVFDRPLRHADGFPPERLDQAIAYIAGQENPPTGWQAAVLDASARLEDILLAAPNAIVGWRSRLEGTLALIHAKPKGFRPNFLRATLASRTKEVMLQHESATEADLRFCVGRNLDGRTGLIGKRVALIGCGTIGGYLAHLLVQNGAGCDAPLTLYDPDTLKPGNLGRHVLGFGDLSRPKAEALAAFVQGFHPDVDVTYRQGNALADWDALARCDLVIDATGDANVSTALNGLYLRARRDGQQLALLHAWVFGNGVAGQSFLNLGDELACYRCLRAGFGGQWRYNPMRDPDAEVRRATAHCGEGGYVPFPSDAPVAAAAVAVRAAVDWAGGEPGHRLRTTIVDPVHGRDRLAWVSPTPLAQCAACSA